ncbi:hypothetical protein OG897_28060 [Streptomyces sp. NBC_00237]|uniref:hypothetical protein n=1 Tax=Streptomyces sp. NBC_00237 TaxID=2975687 RepID=UPI00225AFAB6|nr:hypothetical protein [Streptomyces sp. NBC_00237]MCX5205299.1 hypothetical protein [Streptomyces sp. NBC_00237]
MTAPTPGGSLPPPRRGTPHRQKGSETFGLVALMAFGLLVVAGAVALVVWGFRAMVDQQRAAPYGDVPVVKLTDRIPFDDGLPPRRKEPEDAKEPKGSEGMDRVRSEIRDGFLPMLGRPTAEVVIDCGKATLGSSPFECTARELAPVGREALTARYTVVISDLRASRVDHTMVETTWQQDVRPKKAPVLRNAVYRKAFRQLTEVHENSQAACDPGIPELMLLAPGTRTTYRCYVRHKHWWTTYRVDIGKRGQVDLTALTDEEVTSWPSPPPSPK